MRANCFGMGLAGVWLLGAMAASPAARAADGACDRACLKRGLVDGIVRFDHAGEDKTTLWNDFPDRSLVLNVPYGMRAGWDKKE
jgi:hypothetical protein